MSKVGIRRTIGPMKSRLKDRLNVAKELPATAIPDDRNELKGHIDDLQSSLDALAKAKDNLQRKFDEWSNVLDDDEDEQAHFDASCDEIVNLLIDADDIACQLNVAINSRKDLLADRTLSPMPNPIQNNQTATVPAANVSAGTPNGHAHSNFKAPKIRLPTFDGDYMQFKQFWGIFEANIHNRTDMEDIEKFTYLVSQLEGDAKKAIAGVMINNDNYEVAVALLKSRFDRADERIVSLLYSEFMGLDQCSGKFTDKQRTWDECERIFRQLETAGQDVNSNNALVVGMLSKFPSGFVRDLQRFYGIGTTNTLSEVREGIRKFLAEEETTASVLGDLRSMTVSRDRDNPRNSRGSKSFGGDQGNYAHDGYKTSALPTIEFRRNERAGTTTPSRNCYFCGGRHFNGDCTAYSTAKSRFERLAALGRCTRCLRFHKDHMHCHTQIKCVFCHTTNVHASALCPSQHADKTTLPAQPTESKLNVAAPAYVPPTQQNPIPPAESASSPPAPGQPGELTVLNSDVKPALFQTAKTTAINPTTGRRMNVRLAMDTLSSRSYIREDVARQLGLASDQSQKLYVSVFGTSKSLEVPTSRVEFDVVFRDGTLYRMEANTTKVICQTGVIPDSWSNQERQTLGNFAGALADDPFDSNGVVDILVGANMVWDFISGSKVITDAKSLFLIPSKFGLMLAGQSQSMQDDNGPTMLCLTESPCRFPSELGHVSCDTKFQASYPDIDEFWQLEKIGITDDPIESDDDKALDKFNETIKFEEGRYQVTLTWIEEKRDHLPTNYDVAYDRFRSLSRRLRTNSELLQSYRDIIKLQQERKIIEDVPDSEIETTNTVHYLPHHPVFKPSSNTTKVRIVYDAAAKKNRNSPSLNECLLRGPVILPDLCQLLMRTRTKEIVIISDIEKAFLQVGLQRHERDVTRFLWFKDDTNPSLTNNIIVKRFTRVNFGVICSPFLLGATLQHHLTLENSEFAESLRDNIYVDNVISGLDRGSDPVAYYRQLKALFSRAGMNIFEFCSNSPVFRASVPEVDQVKQPDVRVLGLKWDSLGDDTLRLTPSSKLGSTSHATKRTVLQAVASVFDPLGFFQPILLPAKCFLQKLWKLKYDWDIALEPSLQAEWETLHSFLNTLFQHRIPRFIGKISSGTTIAVFCDASALAYATTVYLRCRQDKSYSTNLIFAKSRLAPSGKSSSGTNPSADKVNIPRLELLGALIGVRAGIFCRNGLKISDAKLDIFIDSQCVLRWIGSSASLKRFVANRIEEIRKTSHCEFHYVASEDNPADLSTRGKLPDELFSSKLWWNGPSWLSEDRTSWPKSDMPQLDDNTVSQITSEIRPVHFGFTMVTAESETPKTNFLTIDPTTISSFAKLIRVSAFCLKFLKAKIWDNLSARSRNSKPVLSDLFSRISDESSISTDDYESAKFGWVRCMQQAHFTDVIQSLKANEPIQRPAQFVEQLGLEIDDNGFLRTRGRFEHADISDTARAPYLLPKDDHVTSMIIEDVHSEAMHSGVAHTLSLLRQLFWVPHGRAQVRRIVKACIVCRRYKSATPFKLPPFPPLPRERVSRSAPFQSVGLDYFGPVSVKVKEITTKMWVCLFTCLSIRAIHLEPVMDFSAVEFLHGLIRFTSRRGVPNSIICDNAGQFNLVKILGDKAWPRTPTDESITSYSASHGIKWKFITELAPWQGGFYERLVGLVKTALRTSIRSKLLSWTDFVTLLTEAEAVVNSRPLTYVGDDIESNFRVLRPCDFLLSLPSAISDSSNGHEVSTKDFSDVGKRLVSIWKQRCRTLEKLWSCWYEDYLLSLRERRKISHKAGRSDVDKTPLLGQVVLICDSNAPRGRWRLARITALLPGNDGRIRAAELRLSNGSQLRRALNHLVPLEVERETETDDATDEGEQENATDEGEQDTETDDATNADDATNTNSDHDASQAQNDLPQPKPPSTDGGQIHQSDPTSEEDEFDFLGFSQDDIQHAVDALQRFDSLDPDEVVGSV